MRYPLAPNGVFWTLQGEGCLSGEPMVFVRLAGCSIGCPQCDTDYRVASRATVEELVSRVRAVVPPVCTWPWVWITGGEPTDHDLLPLLTALRLAGFRIALATSGVRSTQHLPINWLSVSPHAPSIVQTAGHELKCVVGLNGLTWADVETLGQLHFPWCWIQPLAGADQKEACDFVLTHPGWRLAIQAHKVWGLP